MKNWEFYEKELKKYNFYFAMKDNQIYQCLNLPCEDCAFYVHKGISCNETKTKWLYQEHKEPIVLTDDEKTLCNLLGRGWIARDECDYLHWYEHKPYKGDCTWIRTRQSRCVNIGGIFPQCKFEFIKWEDEEPWEVKVDD